jgi:hypothetical protein
MKKQSELYLNAVIAMIEKLYHIAGIGHGQLCKIIEQIKQDMKGSDL